MICECDTPVQARPSTPSTSAAARRSQPPRGPFGPHRVSTAGGFDPAERRLVQHLDAVLADPAAHSEIPRLVLAYDVRLNVVRAIRWTDPLEPMYVRRTAVALAESAFHAIQQVEAN